MQGQAGGASEGGAAVANSASSLRTRRPPDRRTNEGVATEAERAPELVLFRDGHATLRIERGAEDTFELVLSVHGEEVTHTISRPRPSPRSDESC